VYLEGYKEMQEIKKVDKELYLGKIKVSDLYIVK
jgi:hypothetical protein